MIAPDRPDEFDHHDDAAALSPTDSGRGWTLLEFALLLLLLFIYAGDPPPMVNEAHYLVKAKNFWQPDYCAADLFASSGKAHTTFYALFGWPTRYWSLETTAWLGRLVGWSMLAAGLLRLCRKLFPTAGTSLGVAVIWIAGIEYGNLAGEWVVGGIEAKVPAYGLVLLALAEMADRKWNRVWPLLGAASAFHVLSGGWSVIAAMLAWLMTERKREDRVQLLSPALFLGGAIALLGLLPAIALTMGANAEDAAAATRIYAYFRIKHHLLPADFLSAWYLRHGLLMVTTLAITWLVPAGDRRWSRLGWFTCGAVAIAGCGLLIGMLPPWAPNLAARLLRFYWFRLTDAIVPLMLALLVMRLILGQRHWRSGSQGRPPSNEKPASDASPAFSVHPQSLFGATLLLLAVVLFAKSSYLSYRLGVPPSVSNVLLGWDVNASPTEQRRVAADWQAVCNWARVSTPDSEVFLTPRHQQTFKWYAGRSEVVSWKDVPQDAANLHEWYRRFVEVFPRRLGTLRVTIRYDRLRELRRRYGVRYLIVDRRVTGPDLPLVRVYPVDGETNQTYAVYRVPH